MITESQLLQHQSRLLSLDDPTCVFPDYAGFNLVNLPHSICRWLGVPGLGDQALATEYPFSGKIFDQVILLLVDGLGWTRLRQWMRSDPEEFAIWNQIFQQERLVPLTAISPSTTCAALTTLNTGRAPAVHGNLAYELWLKEFGVVANMIKHAPMTMRSKAGSLRKCGFQPEKFLPLGTLDAHLLFHGITVETLHPAPIAHSSLTEMLFPAAKGHTYHSLGDLWYQLSATIMNEKDRPKYVFAYWSEIDELSHLYGPDDIRVKQAFRDFTRHFDDLQASLTVSGDRRTLLVITADHGLQATPLHEDFDLNRHREFLAHLAIPPTGENRLPFLHIKAGTEDKIAAYLEEQWPGKFQIFSAAEIVSLGLFGSGPVYEKSTDRLGDLVIIPLGDAYWWWSTRENRLLGRHGGLSRDEMLVPLAFVAC
jgi:hypothetical protein